MLRVKRKIEIIEHYLSRLGLGKVPGIRILYRLYRSVTAWIYDLFVSHGIILLNIQGIKMFVNTYDRGIVPLLMMNGTIEEYDTKLFKSMVKNGMVVIDIGANIGYYTLIASKLVGDSGIVYAFEPEKNNYRLLCKNIVLNCCTNVIPIKKAVSNKSGVTKIWYDKVNFAAPSFAKENVLIFTDNKRRTTSYFDAETVTLDEFIQENNIKRKIDVIKIDAEGAEGLIIDGAKHIMENMDPKIIMEFWPLGLRNLSTDPVELIYKIQRYGFSIQFINEEKKVLESVEKILKSHDNAWLPGGFNLLIQK